MSGGSSRSTSTATVLLEISDAGRVARIHQLKKPVALKADELLTRSFELPPSIAMKIISGAIDDEALSTNFSGVVRSPTISISHGLSGIRLASVLPKRQLEITYLRHDEDEDDTYDSSDYFTLPPRLWIVEYNPAGAVMSCRVFIAVGQQDEKIPVDLNLGEWCAWPYGNAYQDGRVCWGDVVTTGSASPEALDDLFFRSNFNEDLQFIPMPHGGNLARTLRNFRGMPAEALLKDPNINAYPRRA